MFWRRKKLSTGELGEREAQRYLKKRGYEIIDCNYQNKTGRRLGEIDIIAKKEDKIFFIEVKARILDDKRTILPEENITRSKLLKLQRIAQNYIRENNFWDINYQFDAVSIIFDKNNKKVLEIKHLESIFY